MTRVATIVFATFAVGCWEIVPLEATGTSSSGNGGAGTSGASVSSSSAASTSAASGTTIAATVTSTSTISASADASSSVSVYPADLDCQALGYSGVCGASQTVAIFFRVHDEAWATCEPGDMNPEGYCIVQQCVDFTCGVNDCDGGAGNITSSYCAKGTVASIDECADVLGCVGNVAIAADPSNAANCLYRDCGAGTCAPGPPAYCIP